MPLDIFTDFFGGIRKARRASNEIERLSQMNNDELAKIGLNREGITSHVVKKYFK